MSARTSKITEFFRDSDAMGGVMLLALSALFAGSSYNFYGDYQETKTQHSEYVTQYAEQDKNAAQIKEKMNSAAAATGVNSLMALLSAAAGGSLLYQRRKDIKNLSANNRASLS